MKTSLGEEALQQLALAAMEAMEELCADRFERFGTAGNASRIKPISLSAMAARYASGAFNPLIN